MTETIRLFDWLLPERVAACVNPAFGPEVVDLLRQHQIGLLVNLHERADDPELLSSLSAEAVHLPVADFNAPSQEQLQQGVAAMGAALAEGKRVAVHCAAGLGRTGTLLAAYLVSEGAPAEAAIAEVRRVRPGSIETADQVAAVQELARALTAPD